MGRLKKYKIGRRLGAEVFDKCQTQKFALSEARHDKQQKRGSKRKNISNYGKQLLEKQKVRMMYGVSEKQFVRYVSEVVAGRVQNKAMKLCESLESRLDNVIYRLGIATTRQQARQLVSHGHILVNGRRTKVPSYSVKQGDVVSLREGSKEKVIFQDLEKRLQNISIPAWLTFDMTSKEGKVIGLLAEPDAALNFQSVLEFYTR